MDGFRRSSLPLPSTDSPKLDAKFNRNRARQGYALWTTCLTVMCSPIALVLSPFKCCWNALRGVCSSKAKVQSEGPLWAPLRTFLFVALLAVGVPYFVARVRYTLDVHYSWYAYLLLALEMMNIVTLLIQALVLTRATHKTLPHDPVQNVKTIRVLIPCYLECLELVAVTVEAALAAHVPPGIEKHVYLLDDGHDKDKEDWVNSRAKVYKGMLHYHTRTRLPGQINGKSCNINATLRRLYGSENSCVLNGVDPLLGISEVVDISSELVAVFDADQVCSPWFFIRTMEVMGNSALLLTPQRYSNVDPDEDIYNHGNVVWFDYLLDGISGWGCVSCTGSNFLVRPDALKEVGYFPEDTVAEDYALSIELVDQGFTNKYLLEYLAVGEAPEEPDAIFTQRTRWVKGHMQVFFGKRNPLFRRNLGFLKKLFYTYGTWGFVTLAISTPVYILVPVISIWLGVHPIDINNIFMPYSLVYSSIVLLTAYTARSRNDVFQLWLGWVSNNIYWYSCFKGIVSVLMAKITGRLITFDVTPKSGKPKYDNDIASPTSSTDREDEDMLPRSPGLFQRHPSKKGGVVTRGWSRLRKSIPSQEEGYVLLFVLMISIVSTICGCIWLSQNGTDDSKFMKSVSCLWCIQNSIPPFLFVCFLFFKGPSKKKLATVGYLTFITTLIVAFGLCFKYARQEHNFKEIIENSFQFYEAQRSGVLPAEIKEMIPWRGDSALNDRTERGDSLVGGYYDAGDTVKFGLPLAFSMSVLAWGIYEFPENYPNLDRALDTLLWGTDYLVKCHTGPTEFYVQVGNGVEEHNYWEKPEVLLKDYTRVGLLVNSTHPGSDVVGSSAAALAITSLLIANKDIEHSRELLEHAKELYEFGKTYRGKYSDVHEDARIFYPSSDYHDDLGWAALWLYKATGRSEVRYLMEAEEHLASILKPMHYNGLPSHNFNWDSLTQGLCLMLYVETNGDKYLSCIEIHVKTWLNDVPRTPHGLVWQNQYAPLRGSASTALLFVILAKHLKEKGESINTYGTYECWAYKQIRYMLGDSGRSYVVGYGHNPPLRPHHRGASCPQGPEPCKLFGADQSQPNANTVVGALVGGPDENDIYYDSRMDFIQSEVALDYNAGFTGALAGLQGLHQSRGLGKCITGFGIFEWFKVINK